MTDNEAGRSEGKKRCFVVMGFGTKTDLATGRKIDLDKSYKYLIKPVVESKGLACVRADEIVHSGTIDVPMYEELLNADLVIADISTANVNAIYELGIRHALRPRTTIVISENQFKYPFDLNHILITAYSYLEGGGIDYGEVLRFQGVLGGMIDKLMQSPSVDSPVYTFLKELSPPSLARRVAEAFALAGEALVATSKAAVDKAESTRGPGGDQTLSRLVELGEQAIKAGDFAGAKALFGGAVSTLKPAQSKGDPAPLVDPYLIQRLALATYKAGRPDDTSAVQAFQEALRVLEPLKPETSNDPETVGLAGAIEKRLFDKGQGEDHLVRAIRYYSRGYYLRDDYYNGINLAYLLSVRADTPLDPTGADKIADLVSANRIRREVLALCDRELTAIEIRRGQMEQAQAGTPAATAAIKEEQRRSDWELAFWCLATKAEAYFGLGEMANYEATRSQATSIDPTPTSWMVEALDAQIHRLRVPLEAHGHLLEPPWPSSPIASIPASGPR